MAAITPTELTVTEIPGVLESGTGSARVLVHLRATTSALTNTMNLATYVPGIVDIAGVMLNTHNDKSSSTAVTWSTTTVTFANYATPGKCEMGFICTTNNSLVG